MGGEGARLLIQYLLTLTGLRGLTKSFHDFSTSHLCRVLTKKRRQRRRKEDKEEKGEERRQGRRQRQKEKKVKAQVGWKKKGV